jgi:hypothetical protein
MAKITYILSKLIPGLILLTLGSLALWQWWPWLLILLKGSVGLFLILAGAVILAMAKE